MAKLGTITLAGQSGAKYSFEVYPLHQEFNPVAGIYVIAKQYIGTDGQSYHKIIYVGMTGNMCERFGDHHKDRCFSSNDANRISFHSEANEASRRAKETDLIRYYNPPCNG